MADLGLYEKVESTLNATEFFKVLLMVVVLWEISFVKHHWQTSNCFVCGFFFFNPIYVNELTLDFFRKYDSPSHNALI